MMPPNRFYRMREDLIRDALATGVPEDHVRRVVEAAWESLARRFEGRKLNFPNRHSLARGPIDRSEVCRLLDQGMTTLEVADRLGVSRRSVYNAIHAQRRHTREALLAGVRAAGR